MRPPHPELVLARSCWRPARLAALQGSHAAHVTASSRESSAVGLLCVASQCTPPHSSPVRRKAWAALRRERSTLRLRLPRGQQVVQRCRCRCGWPPDSAQRWGVAGVQHAAQRSSLQRRRWCSTAAAARRSACMGRPWRAAWPTRLSALRRAEAAGTSTRGEIRSAAKQSSSSRDSLPWQQQLHAGVGERARERERESSRRARVGLRDADGRVRAAASACRAVPSRTDEGMVAAADTALRGETGGRKRTSPWN